MIPAAFAYHAPASVREALRLLRDHEGEARLLAGGMSLVPAMKMRLVQPEHVIDLGRIGGLVGISAAPALGGGAAPRVEMGAMTTYRRIERSRLIASAAPLLVEAAGSVGDLQVRNRGTIGGSLAHADPAADVPAALLALDARIDVEGGPRGRRAVSAERFFVDAYETVVGPAELITGVGFERLPRRAGSAYVKFANKASRFAIVGVAAIVEPDRQGRCARARIAVTGAGPTPKRARDAERALRGKSLDAESIERAARRAARGIEFLSDIHASPEYREHLTAIIAKRALLAAAARAAAGRRASKE